MTGSCQVWLRYAALVFTVLFVAAGTARGQPTPRVDALIRRIPPDILTRHGIDQWRFDPSRTDWRTVYLTVDGVEPTEIWENQDVSISYTVTNLSRGIATGTVTGSFGNFSLAPTGPNQVNLQPGESFQGRFHMTWPAAPGKQNVVLRYKDKIKCRRIPWNNGASREICVVGVSTYDTVEVEIKSVGEILTSCFPECTGSSPSCFATPAGSDCRPVPPSFPPAGGGDCKNKTYGKNIEVPNEWEQVQDGAKVPLAGRVVTASPSGGDLPWTHPFGFDYTFNTALDTPYVAYVNDRGLFTKADCSPAGRNSPRGDTDVCDAFDEEIRHGRKPVAIVHCEIEKGLLPEQYLPQRGDRLFMRGHRIVDCGHDTFTVEMHPPTLLARAWLDPSDKSVHSTLIASPYWTQQTYEPTGLPLWPQAAAEMAALTAIPAPLNLFPKIEARPFSEPIEATYRVSIPTVRSKHEATLEYHFVTRPGVTVEIKRVNAYQADVRVAMDPVAYEPFRAPECTPRRYTLSEFEDLGKMAKGTLTDPFQKVAAAALSKDAWLPLVPILGPVLAAATSTATPWLIHTVAAGELGLLTSACTVPDASRALPVEGLFSNQIVTDASQPFPVFGWLQLKWVN